MVGKDTQESLWKNGRFISLFCAHTFSLIGTAIGTSAIALLAEKLSEGSGPRVLGYTLTIRILVFLFLGMLIFSQFDF